MGMRKQMDYNSVHHQIYMSGVELHSNYNDGFNQFEIKKDLHFKCTKCGYEEEIVVRGLQNFFA